jgi:imidazolonepropionase-like amidohydrolase
MLLGVAAALLGLSAQDPTALHGTRPASLELRGARVVRGDGAPPIGPASVFVQDGRIVESLAEPAVVIDATGCTVLPGLVSTHAHLHTQQAEVPIPIEYVTKLWLACGITAVRDLGSAYSQSARFRARQRDGELAAPRLYLFRTFGQVDDEDAARARVRSFKEGGADGIKLWSNISYPREILAAILAEAQQQGLPTTAHIGVGPTDAVDYAELGVGGIEHWYGVPDAALPGRVQDFPPGFSYSNEVDRFREAGRLWRQADPERLGGVLASLVEHGMRWSPTLAVYEASRDLVRAQNQPWFGEWLHPALRRFFTPNLDYHGSYFLGWTSRDEADWRENYRLWMGALRQFAALGGEVTTGEDAGYIYLLYGFGLVRELELQLEAGFHPLEVLMHATWHGAKALGREREFGRILPGMAADLCVVRGDPLANLKVFYPTGCDRLEGGRAVPDGGVQWTIVDGRLWHGPRLSLEIKELAAGTAAEPAAAPASGKAEENRRQSR